MDFSSVSRALPLLALCACATATPAAKTTAPAAKGEPAAAVAAAPAPFPSTYKPLPSTPVLLRNATILTGTGGRIDGGSVLLRDGKIESVGQNVEAQGVEVVDATGKWVTPGIIDVHSHLGDYPSPGVDAHGDGNEATNPVTAEVWAEHSVWPQDPQFPLALAGGVTAMQVLPGSANLIGGRGVTLKNVPATTVQEMKFPGAPHGLKMACGENPKRVYGRQHRSPATRMGNVAGYRAAWIKAQGYQRKWGEYQRKKAAGEKADPPDRDLAMETLVGVLEGEILVHNHCYRADEMAQMLDIAREFGYKIAAFHHGVEAYKLADALAKEGVCGALWADWWGFKLEAFDGVRENLALVDRPEGGCAIVHSDSAEGIQRLNQEAAKAMAAANRSGIPGLGVSREHAMRWLTSNAAKSLGIADRTGSLEAGKMADVVVWSGDPFSVYTRAERVYIDGALVFDLGDPARRPRTDFELGLRSDRGEPGEGGGR